MLTTRLPSHCNLSVEQPPGRDSRRGTALLQLTSLLVNSTDSLNCVVRSCFHKVNRRQAREGALGYKVNRRQARQGESPPGERGCPGVRGEIDMQTESYATVRLIRH